METLFDARFVRLLATAALALPTLVAAETADELQARNNRGLQIIGEFANKACPLPLDGKLNDVEVSAKADAALNAALKKLVDAKLEGAAKFKHEDDRSALLSKDVLPALKDRAQCFQMLMDRLVPIFLNVPGRPVSTGGGSTSPPSTRHLPDIRGSTFRSTSTALIREVPNQAGCTERETYSEAIQFSGSGDLTALKAVRYVFQQSERCYAPFHSCAHDAPRIEGGARLVRMPTAASEACFINVPPQTRRMSLNIVPSGNYTETVVESPSSFYLAPVLDVGAETSGKVEFLGNNQVVRFDGSRSYALSAN